MDYIIRNGRLLPDPENSLPGIRVYSNSIAKRVMKMFGKTYDIDINGTIYTINKKSAMNNYSILVSSRIKLDMTKIPEKALNSVARALVLSDLAAVRKNYKPDTKQRRVCDALLQQLRNLNASEINYIELRKQQNLPNNVVNVPSALNNAIQELTKMQMEGDRDNVAEIIGKMKINSTLLYSPGKALDKISTNEENSTM